MFEVFGSQLLQLVLWVLSAIVLVIPIALAIIFAKAIGRAVFRKRQQSSFVTTELLWRRFGWLTIILLVFACWLVFVWLTQALIAPAFGIVCEMPMEAWAAGFWIYFALFGIGSFFSLMVGFYFGE